MNKIYRFLFVAVLLSVFNSLAFSQSPACANFSGVFISDSLEQNLPEYYICSGSNIYLKSINTPTGSTFQWKMNGVDISGATARILNVTSEGLYSLTLTQGACTATSSGIIVRPTFSVANYSISSNNVTQACTGDGITLTTVKGIGLTYQWKKDNVNIAGAANAPTYIATSTGNYSLTVLQGTCTINSNNSIALNFSNTANPVVITKKITVCEGKTTTLKASNINATHTLQWFKDGVAVSGANKDSLVVSQTGNYFLQTTRGSCTGNSTSIAISIKNSRLPPPQIQQNNPNDFETCSNNIVKLKVIDYTDGSLTWLKEGNTIMNESGAELIVRESGNYSVRYQGNDLCFSQSIVIPVKISNVATLSFDGNNYTILSGQTANVNYIFNGTAPIVLGLKLGNTNFPGLRFVASSPRSFRFGNSTSTTTFSTYTFANACGVGTFSNPATITVGNCTPATNIQTISKNGSPCIGGRMTLTATATGSGNLTYQWQKDGVDINGATGSSYNVNNFNYNDYSYYKVKVTGACGTVSSENIRESDVIYGSTASARLDFPAYVNSDILLKANTNSSYGYVSHTFSWTGPNNFTSTLQNPTLPNASSITNGVYNVSITNGGGCTNNSSIIVTAIPCYTSKAISLNNGNWNTASTWVCGQIPTPTLDTIIEQGHTVSLPNGYQGNTKKLELKGNLTQGTGASVRVSN
jgi:trimeric autotransporter adhesin